MSANNEAKASLISNKNPEKSRNYWWSPFLAAGMGSASVSSHSLGLFSPSSPRVELADECELASAVETKPLRK
jgi:hypothetical protein